MTKPRWRLLTDATRRELQVGDVVCALGHMTGNEIVGPIVAFHWDSLFSDYWWATIDVQVGTSTQPIDRVMAVRVDNPSEGKHDDDRRAFA